MFLTIQTHMYPPAQNRIYHNKEFKLKISIFSLYPQQLKFGKELDKQTQPEILMLKNQEFPRIFVNN